MLIDGYNEVMKQSKTVEIGELLFWIVSCSSTIEAVYSGRFSGASAVAWSTAFIVFGVAWTIDSFSRIHETSGNPVAVALCWALILSGFAMIYFANRGWVVFGSSFSLALAARRLPGVTSERNSWLAVVAIETVLLAFLAWKGRPGAVLETGSPVAVFLIVFVSYSVRTARERAARDELAVANIQLRANRELLAENSRTAERLRISRDLHDTLGHHLAALSIQLDVASRRSEGVATDNIREAHAIARLLLSDVRDVVGTLRNEGRVNLTDIVRPLCRNIGELQVHLDAPNNVVVADSARAEAIIRCVQEIVTNALKHAAARNLWIRIIQNTAGVAIHARDDGRGSAKIALGTGLTGMNERFAQLDGHVETFSTADNGFEIRAFMPHAEAAT